MEEWYEDDTPRDLSKYSDWSKEEIDTEIRRLEEEHLREMIWKNDMESGIDYLANYLCINEKDEKQVEVANVLQMLIDDKKITHDQLQTVLSYIREINIRCGMYDSTIDNE